MFKISSALPLSVRWTPTHLRPAFGSSNKKSHNPQKKSQIRICYHACKCRFRKLSMGQTMKCSAILRTAQPSEQLGTKFSTCLLLLQAERIFESSAACTHHPPFSRVLCSLAFLLMNWFMSTQTSSSLEWESIAHQIIDRSIHLCPPTPVLHISQPLSTVHCIEIRGTKWPADDTPRLDALINNASPTQRFSHALFVLSFLAIYQSSPSDWMIEE